MQKTMDVFQKRKLTYTAVFLAALAIFAGSSLVTQFNAVQGLASFPAAIGWIVENLIPDQTALERLPKILDKLLETALLDPLMRVAASGLES